MSSARETIFAMVTNDTPTAFHEVARAASRFDELWDYYLLQTPYGAVLQAPFYTVAHVVLDDCNFDDNTIDYCLSQAGVWKSVHKMDTRLVDLRDSDPSAELNDWGGQFIEDYAAAIVDFLNWLKTLPADIRETP